MDDDEISRLRGQLRQLADQVTAPPESVERVSTMVRRRRRTQMAATAGFSLTFLVVAVVWAGFGSRMGSDDSATMTTRTTLPPNATECSPTPQIPDPGSPGIPGIPEGAQEMIACRYRSLTSSMVDAPLVASVQIIGGEARDLVAAIRDSPVSTAPRRRCPAPDTWETWRIRATSGQETVLLVQLWSCEHITDGTRAVEIPPRAREGLAG
ncbi:hypothetical protein [Sphaerisporangium sp. NPDC051011]|uniref:hypothetical protein n=1 Tax=Sphaerisporangium sp. NPDC051011 TaxID=3155792 RepID=UPI0033CBB810